jgi:DNA repair exonuclease SbcCD nuclease subunit
MKIYHVSDIHLGRKRLDGRLPDQDFVTAFRFIAEASVRDKADVILITGDLFDRALVEPAQLQQAQVVLRFLKDNSIRVIAVEGNHDKAFVHSDEQTWMQFLADEDLLILLRPRFNAEGAVLEPLDSGTRSGSWVDIGGVRFVGAGYLGAATPAKVRQILDRLEQGLPNILLLHAGPEYFVGEGGGFSTDDLRAMEEKVCYLALGHIHKPMRYGDWACNPGSPENCELREAAYEKDKNGATVPRGYAVVEIDPAQPAKPLSIEVRSNPRRPIHRILLDCAPFGNKTKNGAEALIDAAVIAIDQIKPANDAVIDLWLTGKLNLNRIALDQSLAAVQIGSAAGVFAVALDTTHLNVGDGFSTGSPADIGGISRDQLEREAIRSLINEGHVWGLEAERENISELFYDLKESVRVKRTAEEIADQIATNPLVEVIRIAKSDAVAPQPSAAAESQGEPAA